LAEGPLSRSEEKELKRSDWIRAIAYLLIMIAVIVWGAFLMLPVFWQPWLMVTAVLVYSLVVWHTRHFDYRCSKCQEEFGISVISDLISPQGIGQGGSWKYLKCPKCGTRTRAKTIRKMEFSNGKSGRMK
jgi:hypothetical protein